MGARTEGRLDTLLSARCSKCRDEVAEWAPVVNFGELQFHERCRPACCTCGDSLGSGEGGWRSEGYVVSETWGYSVRPVRFWCPDCLGTVLRDPPRGSD